MRKIVVYGVGNNCENLLLNDLWNEYSIVAYVDKNKAGQIYRGYVIHEPYQVWELDFDEIWITNADGFEIKYFLIVDLNIPHEKIKDVQDINRICLENCVNKSKYVMITNNMDYLNYPYESLVEDDEMYMVYLLSQTKPLIVKNPVAYEKKVFILRSHMLGDMIRNNMVDDLHCLFPNARYVLILSDMVYGKHGYAARDNCWECFDDIKKRFSVITTYHKQEAEEFNISYMPQPYAIKHIDYDTVKNEGYVLFVGNAKDRFNSLISIYKALTSKGICCKFWINQVPEDNIDRSLSGITYNEKMKYKDYLELAKNCGCMLEVSYEGNETSMRYVEAVVLGKRILINDKNVKTRPFYSPQNVSILDKELSISVEWIINEEQVDYHYDGRYNPIHWLEYIKQELGRYNML